MKQLYRTHPLSEEGLTLLRVGDHALPRRHGRKQEPVRIAPTPVEAAQAVATDARAPEADHSTED